MTREEAIKVFLDRGWITLEGGTYFDGDKWREAIMVISDYFRKEYKALEQEPKTGHWIEHPEIETSTPEYLMFYKCSECGDKQCFCKSDFHKKHFCNNCGARMVEPQESEGEE